MRYYQIVSTKAEHVAQWVVIALGFSIPISTAADDILIGVAILLWLLSNSYRDRILNIRENPVALWATVVFGMYLLGMLYSIADRKDVLDALLKSAYLLLIPLFMAFFREKKVRDLAIGGFLAASILVLILSYLIGLDLLPPIKLLKGNVDKPIVFKYHITHSFLMSFAAFLFALRARESRAGRYRVVWSLLSSLAVYNVFFMIPSRTGQLVMLVLMIYFFFGWFRWCGLLLSAFILVSVVGAGLMTSSGSWYRGYEKLVREYREWEPGRAQIGESAKLRIDFYRNSGGIIMENPVFGVGTGGFAKAYAAKAGPSAFVYTDNPHNEYLLVAVQFGLVGLGVWLFLFFREWILVARLSAVFDRAVARGLVLAILAASMVSSTLFDHTERVFFVWFSALLFASLNQKPEKETVEA
jgi:O-antigen ligase